jgi:hypothetical protein
MTELSDMGRFPVAIYLGATANILLTIALTWKVHGWSGGDWFYLLPWAVLMPALNVLPVLLLRSTEKSPREFPTLSKMSFFGDQHRFSTWVYAVAAGNMFFWIVFSWWAFQQSASVAILSLTLLVAFSCTFVPLWRRFIPVLRS